MGNHFLPERVAGATAKAASSLLISNGKAESVIVTSRGEFNRWVAGQLQGYFEKFSDVQIPIISPAEARQQARDLAWILVVSSQANKLGLASRHEEIGEFREVQNRWFHPQDDSAGWAVGNGGGRLW